MRLANRISVIGFAAALSACATSSLLPDLTVSRLEATPAQATAGTEITITSAIRNAGEMRAALPVVIDVQLFAGENETTPIADLTAWAQTDGEPLASGEIIEDAAKVKVPANLKAGAYFICGKVDPDDAIRESFEDNNRVCAPFTILSGPPVRADLVIEKITPLGQEQASLKVKVRIKNASAAPANGPLRIMAFRRSPRQPLLLIECPLTEGQLAAGSPASCPDLAVTGPLAPGASTELVGYFAYVVANGAEFVRTPVNQDYRKPAISRTVDFMVDGCFPPTDGRPVTCAIEEIDELNNFRAATLKVR